MKKVLVINGPNLNMLGIREPDIYGRATLADLEEYVSKAADRLGLSVDFFQSNHEGAIIDVIHSAMGKYDGIVINPGAYTHYSYAIHDALTSVPTPAIEVHLSDINARESFRRVSVTAPACVLQLVGLGFEGYARALEALLGLSLTL